MVREQISARERPCWSGRLAAKPFAFAGRFGADGERGGEARPAFRYLDGAGDGEPQKRTVRAAYGLGDLAAETGDGTATQPDGPGPNASGGAGVRVAIHPKYPQRAGHQLCQVGLQPLSDTAGVVLFGHRPAIASLD